MSRHSCWLGLILTSLVSVGPAAAQPELSDNPPPAAPSPSAQPPLLPPVAPPGPPTPAAVPPPVVEAITFDDPSTPAAKDDDCCFYVGTDGMEYLLWWLKSGPVPPLVTRSRTGPPILGLPDTRVIAGGEPVNLDAFSGGRFTLGSRWGHAGVGTEYTYFFLGTRTTSLAAGPAGGNVGRPVVNAVTSAETFVPVSGPTVGGGAYTATASARAQGVEANVVTNLLRGDRGSLTGLVGYRFLQVHEGLFVGQSGNMLIPGGPIPFHLGDQVDAHNRFHGGQVGLRADARKGPVFVEVAGKIAFGATTEVVKVGGITGPNPVAGGLLALPSNSGRVARDVFAVVPEASWKFGFEHDKHRVFVGYDFLYLSDAVRAGDQIDRTVNLGQVPVLGGSPAFAGPERPRLAVKSTDLWLQGLMIGMETRW